MGKLTGLAKEQDRALDLLKGVPAVAELFYLAGGSAIAWHLRHRRSNDLDLFSLTPSVDLERIRSDVMDDLPAAKSMSTSDVAMKLKIASTPVDFVRYPYPPLDPPLAGPRGFPVAGLRDLAAMKVATIVSRGLRRDFWDLHTILTRGMSLTDAIACYRRRFRLEESASYAALRALTYFVDAERQSAAPKGLTAPKWTKIKHFFERQASLLMRPAKR